VLWCSIIIYHDIFILIQVTHAPSTVTVHRPSKRGTMLLQTQLIVATSGLGTQEKTLCSRVHATSKIKPTPMTNESTVTVRVKWVQERLSLLSGVLLTVRPNYVRL